jgi:hypothetical protein
MGSPHGVWQGDRAHLRTAAYASRFALFLDNSAFHIDPRLEITNGRVLDAGGSQGAVQVELG